MEKFLAIAIKEELKKLRWNEFLYEGEVFMLIEPILWEFNMLNVNSKDLLNLVYGEIYGS